MTLTSINKPIKQFFLYIYTCMHTFILFYFTCFYFYIFGPCLTEFEWTGLGWTQPPQARQFLPANVREWFTHACYSHHTIKSRIHSVGELFCKIGDTYLGAGWRRWRAVPPFVYFSSGSFFSFAFSRCNLCLCLFSSVFF